MVVNSLLAKITLPKKTCQLDAHKFCPDRTLSFLSLLFSIRVARFGSVRLRFGDGTVRAVTVFGSGGSSKKGGFVCFSAVSQRGRFRFRFLANGSGGSAFGSCTNGSDSSGFWFRFGSWATLLLAKITLPKENLPIGRT